MIRQDQHPVVLSGIVHSLFHQSNEPLIQIFDRLDLLVNESLVAHLVRRFYMDIDKIAAIL